MIKMGIIIDKRIKNVIAFLITFLETIYICNLIQLSEKELFRNKEWEKTLQFIGSCNFDIYFFRFL